MRPIDFQGALKQHIDLDLAIGESPVWDAGRNLLWFVDILAPCIYALDPETNGLTSYPMPCAVGSIGLASGGRLVAALRTGVHLFDPVSRTLEFLVHPEPDMDMNRLNDGKVGPDGCFWVGSMHDSLPREPTGSLYRVTSTGECTRVVKGLKVSNGLAWSPDGNTLYHADSRGAYVQAYDFDPESGHLSGERRLATFTESDGLPDGAAMDVDGNYWVAGVTAGRITKFAPDGRIADTFALPMSAPTMPCFGGGDLKTLFITSLRTDRPGRYEMGTLISVEMDVAGTPTGVFG
ncbi:SMP-30/gluconolactonase/LRE family protein [Mesorhizobium sp. B4-1-1]|uniref:SMP-30/gluconolactonase/LRE family protein n=1 Tax=Mesorhizobium sp. B4-1-1 TaxID=2589890 RepID=UPI001125E50E|nr:SMP-30/gluconolactonase/LRE family protein [Mesorhizobium sp. B4-1-1]TPI21090.1 SMP-30/gluconolactonase/LRE family protein [Mesorhizobium sp. B4-1-1]